MLPVLRLRYVEFCPLPVFGSVHSMSSKPLDSSLAYQWACKALKSRGEALRSSEGVFLSRLDLLIADLDVVLRPLRVFLRFLRLGVLMGYLWRITTPNMVRVTMVFMRKWILSSDFRYLRRFNLTSLLTSTPACMRGRRSLGLSSDHSSYSIEDCIPFDDLTCLRLS